MYRINFSFLRTYYPLILQGLQLTLLIVVLSELFSFALGFVLAFMQRSKVKWCRKFSEIWVNVLRNTPFLVQLFFLFYGLPNIGIKTDPLVTSVIALSINMSAPNCEAIRSGLLAVKSSYVSAMEALGFSRRQVVWYLLIPLSLRLSFRGLTNNLVGLIITSSIAFSVSTMELMGAMKLISSKTGRPFEAFILILIFYCILTFIASFAAKAIDRKIRVVL